ncbi:MAG: hypothetical protein LBC80_09955 [Treponema sp.]|nr:hypothetical protein [Treponema sp.]
MKIRFSNLIWGTFLLLAAGFLLFNQFDNFMNISVGSIIVSILALAFIVQCIAHLRFAFLPIPIAVLYVIFQAPLELPFVQTRIVVIASILASIGLAILFPKKNCCNHFKFKHYSGSKNHQPISIENSNNDNNPSVNVNFGHVSRRLQADNLETAEFNCNFGALEIFFDQVNLSPNGAVVDLNCSFGAIQLLVPKNWHIIDRLNCSLGGVNIDKNFSAQSDNIPQLTLNGSVSMGGIEVKCI